MTSSKQIKSSFLIFLYSGGWNGKRYKDRKGRTQYYGRDTVSDEILQWVPESKTWEQIGTLKLQGVPQLSIHLVFVILPASTHPNCKSWGSFDKFRTFAT